MVATGGRQRWLEVVFHNSLLFVVDCCIEQITSGILVLKTIEIIFKNYEISWNLKRFWLTGNMKSELPDMHTAWKVSKYGVISGPHFSVFSPNAGKYEPEITPYLDTLTQCSFHATDLFLYLKSIRKLLVFWCFQRVQKKTAVWHETEY